MTTLYDQWGLPIEHELERAFRRLVEASTSTSTGGSTMTRFLRIDTDNNCSVHDVETGSLVVVQKLVGGYIELVRLNGGIDLYIDEDGKGRGLDPNMLAMLLVQHTGTQLLPGDVIVGTVLVFGGHDEEGNDLDVPEATVEWLKRSPLTIFADDPKKATWPPAEPEDG